MQYGGLMGGIYKVSDVLMRLAYVNFLWIVGLLPGLVIFGVMPSTVALFNVVRSWLLEDDELVIHRKFVATYKKEFFKSNLLGLPILVIGYGLYINSQFLGVVNDGAFLTLAILICNILVAIVAGLFILYIFPVYVHFEMGLFQKVKLSVMLGITYPHITFALVVILFLFAALFMVVPALIFFFSASGITYCVMGIYLHKVNDIKDKYYSVKHA
ncbi:YesL family protein [Salipaludibacillus sp. HK11]|uniref:YesL family protein n=1 Tax=Salipaludibacillus sp. HK11 TaxID=3394320 RepID=UPI0039FD431B